MTEGIGPRVLRVRQADGMDLDELIEKAKTPGARPASKGAGSQRRRPRRRDAKERGKKRTGGLRELKR